MGDLADDFEAHTKEPPMPAHVLDFIDEELKARGWTRRDLANRMGGDPAHNELSLQLLELRDPDVS